MKAPIAATPATPHRTTAAARSAVMPPTAHTGQLTARTTAASPSRLSEAGAPGFDAVSNTLPVIM